VSVGVEVTSEWRSAFPGARVGLLVMNGVRNPRSNEALERQAAEVEQRLRARFAGGDRTALQQLPGAQAYAPHYKAFGQNYHVLRQLESVALKGRQLRSPSALVLAMFAVEVETLLLTAGHDLDLVALPLAVDASHDGDMFVGIGGRDIALRPGDMLIRDRAGIISAVIYGPDQRTQLRPETHRALFTVYAPPGIDDSTVTAHLEQLADNVRLIAPEATTTELTLL
jgi:DNA/RNA-binding domain of Phe-tRNA-synthetase-like protein